VGRGLRGGYRGRPRPSRLLALLGAGLLLRVRGVVRTLGIELRSAHCLE
jgi:hypothetical protein